MENVSAVKTRTVAVICDLCSYFIPWQGEQDQPIICERCGHHINKFKPKSLERTLSFTLTALVFYVPALMFPFMSMEFNGQRTSSTIWEGVVQLKNSGSLFIAVVVFLASILIPLVKLLILFYLVFTARKQKRPYFKTNLYRFIEHIGRWSMLDIFLLAVMVAILKFAPWAFVQPEIGSFMFALVVIFTMFASSSFDTRLLWKDSYVKKTE